MLGSRLRKAKDGLVRALGSMPRNNQVGLITFDDAVNAGIPVAPLLTNRFAIADAIHEMRARGETALCDAIKAGFEMTDAAEGEGDSSPMDVAGWEVKKEGVIGDKLAIVTQHPIQIFFIGIGHDADLDVGRMLAAATGAEFQGVTEQDLASLLEEFSKYF